MTFSPAVQPARLQMREWACVHTELEWVYDHEVPKAYRESRTDKTRGGYWAWLVRAGRATVTTEAGERYSAGTGQWLFLPATRLTQRLSTDAHLLSLHFRCEWPSGENILSSHGGLVIDGAGHPQLEKRAVKLERLVRSHIPDADRRYYGCFSDFGRFLEFHVLFQQWLEVWFTVQVRHGAELNRLLTADDRLLRAMSRINSAPVADGLPLRSLLEETGLGDAQLNRLFLEEYGMTVRKCWEARRVKEARRRLETGLTPVKELAYSLGFRSDSHFTMWFKRHTGKRPGEYRRVHRSLGPGD